MKKLYLFALGLYAAHICFSSFKDIENFLKNYNGEPDPSLRLDDKYICCDTCDSN